MKTADTILAALKRHGPMTERELVEQLPYFTREQISTALWRLRRSYTKLVGDHRKKRKVKVQQRIYIAAWEQDREDLGRYDVRARAVYACGAKPDAPKPPPLTDYEKTKRARDRNPCLTLAKRRRVKPLPHSSVFNLGQA